MSYGSLGRSYWVGLAEAEGLSASDALAVRRRAGELFGSGVSGSSARERLRRRAASEVAADVLPARQAEQERQAREQQQREAARRAEIAERNRVQLEGANTRELAGQARSQNLSDVRVGATAQEQAASAPMTRSTGRRTRRRARGLSSTLGITE